MEFIQHTLDWCKGELFEGRIVLLFGLVTIVIALLFWKAGSTPNAKAMLFPLLAVGIMFAGIGGGMLYSNHNRITDYPQAFQNNPTEFIKAEKERTENFISWYPKTRYIFSALAILGIILFLFWATPIGRAIGISLVLMTLATFVVDHFSEERAETYHQKIVKELKLE
jgi:hypothetical protein